MAMSLEEFARRLVDSGVVSRSKVQAALKTLVKKSSQDAEHLARVLVKQEWLTTYQAKQVYRDKGRPLILGNYLVLDKLGQGGMGLVLKARHRRMDRLVALKVLSPAVTKSASARARFQREVRAAARLTHPNVVTAFDADEDAGTHFLVLEYVEGKDLSARVRGHGPLLVEQAVNCVLQAARGLEYAHRQGVIHRDIKPGNLLLDADGLVKILDMGLARLDSPDPRREELTGIGQIMGTVDYMAPEQARDTKSADSRADIYSLGATLWYLLTGRAMYNGESAIQKLMAHQTQPIPSLGQACPTASRALEAIFVRMVAKNADERYSSMRDVIDDLERLDHDAAPPAAFGDFPGEDTQLSEFFRGLAASDGGLAVASPATAKQEVSPALHETVSVIGQILDTDPAIELAPAAPIHRRTKPRRSAWGRGVERLRVPRTLKAQAALAVGLAGGLLGIIGLGLWAALR